MRDRTTVGTPHPVDGVAPAGLARPIGCAAAGLAVGYLVVSLAESLLHAGVHHASLRTRRALGPTVVGPMIRRAHRRHAVGHHRLTFRRDHVTQFASPREVERARAWARRFDDAERIEGDRYGLTIGSATTVGWFVLPVVPVLAVCAARRSTATRVGLFLPLAALPLASKVLHPYLHSSRDQIDARASRPMRRLLRTRAIRYVARHHWVHHADEAVNFNLLPPGDLLLGRSRPPTADEVTEMQRLGMIV